MTSATWNPPGYPQRPEQPWPNQPGPVPEWRPPEWQPGPTRPGQPIHVPPPTYPPPRPPEDVRSLWEDRLLDQRIVQVSGLIDADAAGSLVSRLLLLDSRGRQPVTLRIDSGAADLTAAWTLVDTLDAMVVPVHALVVGEIGGGSLALLAAVTERYTHPHARFRLSEPAMPGITGTATRLVGEAAAHQELVDAFHQRLADLTGKPVDTITADLREGRFLTARAAVEYGLVTDVRPKTVRV